MSKARNQGSATRARPASRSSHYLVRAAVSSLLPAVSTLAWAQETTPPPGQDLEQVIVTGKIIFTQNDAFGATKMGLAIKDTPQTVNVVTADLIDVATLQSFEDFYKVDASSGVTHSLDGWPRNFYRGFAQQGDNTVRVDGFRMPGNIELDLAVFDRFEVIKGPTSTLYGQNNVGGALNAVSKVPLDRFGMEFSAEAAQYNEYRVDADVTGPLFGSDKWSYRLIGAYEDADSFVDFVHKEVQLVSSAIQYAPTDETRMTVRYTRQRTDGGYHFGPILQLAGNGTGDTLDRVLSEGLQIPDVPRSRYFGMPWNNNVKTAEFVQLQGEHSFANDWTLRLHAQHSSTDEHGDQFWVGGPFDENGDADFLWGYGGANEHELYGAEINLFGKVPAFGREHTLFFGVDYNDTSSQSRTAGMFSFPTFNLFNPDYSVPPPASFDDYEYFYGFETDTQLFGATVQLITKPTDRLSVMLGARYSRDKNSDGFAFALSQEELAETPPGITSLTEDEVVMQAGLTYEITDAVSAYASYGETFEPQFGQVFVDGDPDGAPIDPQVGTSYEVGVKADLRADLFFTAAAFHVERSNIALNDILNPGFSIPLGTQRSQGVELGLQGRLMPQLSVNASMAFLDSEFLDGDLRGLQAVNAPRFGLTVFGTYEILDGSLKGLGFGLGVVHKRDIKGFDAGWTEDSGTPVTFDFGDYTELDARVFYDIGRWKFLLSATNILDEQYYSQTFEELWWSTNVNPPATIRGRVTYKF
jgi:TonB-dependent siderophore receptor